MSIVIENATKIYGSSPVVNRVSLEILPGEFLVLIGPSGSGKSTLLRMIAGLTSMDAGRVVLHETDVTDLPPQRRGVGFVFQNYALFKHMTAAENIEYGLKVRRATRRHRHERVAQLLELVGLAGLGGRLPAQLSGGQQQRVALARALAFNPEVLLLDEPFGALDARIRTELRRSIKRIQREIGISTIFVTHDQEEAFALADRLGIMHDGELVEIGACEDLYHTPEHEFTASFLGGANVLIGATTETGIRLGGSVFRYGSSGVEHDAGRIAKVLIRPEDVIVSRSPSHQDGRFVAEGIVRECAFGGAYERLRVALDAEYDLQILSPEYETPNHAAHLDAQRPRSESLGGRLRVDDKVYVFFRRVHCLQAVTSVPVLTGGEVTAFLRRCHSGGVANPLQSASLNQFPSVKAEPHSGVDLMKREHKVLVWFGDPREIHRVVIQLGDDPEANRALLAFARETFANGRPPAFDLLLVRAHEHGRNAENRRLLDAASSALQPLGGPVRNRIRFGDPSRELRKAVGQSGADFLIAHLPYEARAAHANDELSHWVLQRLGLVTTVFFTPEDSTQLVEKAA